MYLKLPWKKGRLLKIKSFNGSRASRAAAQRQQQDYHLPLLFQLKY